VTAPDLRLAVPAAGGWLAAAVLIGVPDAALPALVVAWLGTGVLLVVRPRLALVGLAVALCCTAVAVHGPGRTPEVLVDAASAHRTVAMVVTPTRSVTPVSPYFEGTIVEAEGRAMGVPVLVFGAPAERAGIGSRIAVTGTLVVAEGGDDRAFLVFARGSPEIVAGPPWYLAWADGLRGRFLAVATGLPGDGGDLLAGLAIGDTSDVRPDLDAAMKASSLTHLTAVSGANCAVVVGLVMLAGGAAGVPRGVRIGASVVVLIGFVVLVTPEPSVLRAAAMAALVLVTLGVGRPVRGIPVLSLAILCLLVADPWLARSYGFALSVLATAGLLLFASPIAQRLERWMPRWLALVIAVPLAAQLACQPLLITLNAALPTYGVVANVLAEPAAPLATVVGLAACVTLAVVPPVGELLCAIAWLPSAWIAAVARFFAGAPAAQLPWPGELPGVLLAVALSAGVLLALRWRWARLGLVMAVVVYGAVVGGSRVGLMLTRPSDWQYAACDVGQGDAFLVRDGEGVMLIDAGPEPEPLASCLDELGVGRVDVLVLTHWDLDHVGGVDAVLGRVDRVLVGPADGDSEHIIAALSSGGAIVEQASAGLTGALGDLEWRVLWPPTRLAGLEPGNDASITLRVDCARDCLSGLFLGDLDEQAQSRLPPTDGVDVVKVAHHGSADQSERLYERAGATVGLIGVGQGNDYGHPTDELLGILNRAGTLPVRTDEHGLVLLAPGDEPGAVSVWTGR